MTKTFRDYPIQDKETVMIEGEIVYSRLNKKIDGQELADNQARSVKFGQQPKTKPYYTITLKNANIINQTPGTETPMETFWREKKLYTSKNEPGVIRTTAESTSKFAIPLAHLDETGELSEFKLPDTQELATGSKVRLIVNAFTSPNGKGYGMQGVIVIDPVVKYFKGGLTSVFENYGYKMTNKTEVAMESVEPENPSPVVDGSAYAPTPSAPQVNQGFAQAVPPTSEAPAQDPAAMKNPWAGNSNPGSNNPFTGQ